MAGNRFSLTRVRLRNYRSIASADVSLGAMLLLVGPTGQARATSSTRSGSPRSRCRPRWIRHCASAAGDGGLPQAASGKERERSQGGCAARRFTTGLEFRSENFQGAYGYAVDAKRGGGYFIARESCDVRFGSRAVARFSVRGGELEPATEPVMPPASDQRLYLAAAAGQDAVRPVFDGMSGIGVFNLNPDVMRQPQPATPGNCCAATGPTPPAS